LSKWAYLFPSQTSFFFSQMIEESDLQPQRGQ
jgi:hypothetical protein